MNQDESKAWQLTVNGRVQGVGFRWFTLSVAVKLGVRGYVKNLPSSRQVEILAVCPPEVMLDFLRMIKQGPPLAHVTDVDLSELAVIPDVEEFSVR